jgi:Protein of unknown function (DUF3027)
MPPDKEQSLTVSPTRTRSREPDEACAEAVELARAAAQAIAMAGQVGPHRGIEVDGDRVVTHLFDCQDPAYTGWRWAITVARASRARLVTVSEGVLLPGPDSLLAPDWIPWRDRVRPGDVGIGDLLPAGQDDERLVPAAVLEGDDGVLDWDEGPHAEPPPAADASAGPVRARVLSAIGRDATAVRWYDSEHGPRTPLAHAAPAPCATCGFLVRLGSPLGRVFGVCANEYAPDDGKVVSMDHGCGAHSEAMIPAGSFGTIAPVVDELGYDLVDAPGISMAETVFESLDHG